MSDSTGPSFVERLLRIPSDQLLQVDKDELADTEGKFAWVRHFSWHPIVATVERLRTLPFQIDIVPAVGNHKLYPEMQEFVDECLEEGYEFLFFIKAEGCQDDDLVNEIMEWFIASCGLSLEGEPAIFEFHNGLSAIFAFKHGDGIETRPADEIWESIQDRLDQG